MGMLRSLLVNALVALALATVGCAAGGPAPDGDPDFGAPSDELLAALAGDPSGTALEVWAHDTGLEALARAAAARIYAATGIAVAVNAEGTLYRAVPLFWTNAGAAEDWIGLCHNGPGEQDWLAVDIVSMPGVRETVVLHEILHALGVAHIEEGAGVMSPHVDAPQRLTSVDLEAVCAVRDCGVFVPEG